MDDDRLTIHSQITFTYYTDLQPAADFYGRVLGLELVEDQGWAKIYRVDQGAFVGIVDGSHGFCRPQPHNAVLITLLVNDVAGWYEYLQERGVKLLTAVGERADIQVRNFFLEDPGGYALEIQQFLDPAVAAIFHHD